MNAYDIRQGDTHGEDATTFWCREIAAQLSEANHLARLRLAIEYQQSTEQMPDNLRAEIEVATEGLPQIFTVGKALRSPGFCTACASQIEIGDSFRWCQALGEPRAWHLECTPSEGNI